jgi:hypothetical protein
MSPALRSSSQHVTRPTEPSERDVDHVSDAPATVNQYDMASDRIVAVVRRRRRQFGVEIRRHRMASRAPVAIEHETDLKTRLPNSGKVVLDAESDDGMVAVIGPPVAADFAFVIVKPRMMRIPVMFVIFMAVGVAVTIVVIVALVVMFMAMTVIVFVTLRNDHATGE